MKKSVVFLFCLFIFGSQAVMADKVSSSKAILAAVDANKKLAKLGFEWRDTYKKIIGPAKKAWKKGEYDKAEKMAKKVMGLVALGKEQFKRSHNAKLIN